ncbi:hypothetical protein [Jannaschia formosa]|uniref:hypothetical protein n=1 Tax=Jannaschia formosa TaxID=2259592 RepID=UPI000E1BBA72|nr:hypothetical protein [Jannaschia formosa]TFL19819.1 hypothetical protein DR046_00260 [Jannaschia formosa]
MTEIHTAAEALEADALPRAQELRAEGCEPAPPMGRAARSKAAKTPAEWAFQRVVLYLRQFEEGLTPDEEVAMGFTGGAAGVLRIEGLGFSAPDILTFTGRDAQGRRCQQLIHVSRLDILLRAVPRPPEHPEPVRIGFRLARALEEEDGEARDGDAAPAT